MFFVIGSVFFNNSPKPSPNAFSPKIKNGTSAPISFPILNIFSLLSFRSHNLLRAIIVDAALELAPPKPDPVGIFLFTSILTP